MQTRLYREQHGRIRQMLREMHALGSAGADDFQIRTALGRLTGTVKMHLAGEDQGLYPRLMAHADEDVRARARSFQDSMGTLFAAYVDFASKWQSGTALRDEPAAFFREFDGISDALTKRMDLEDNDLYLLADRELAGVV